MVPPTSRIAEALHSRRRFDASLSPIARRYRPRFPNKDFSSVGHRRMQERKQRSIPALSSPFLSFPPPGFQNAGW